MSNAYAYDSDWDYAEACGDDTHAIESRAEELLGDVAALLEQAPGESHREFIRVLDHLLSNFGNVDGEHYKRWVSEALHDMAEALARKQLREVRRGR